MAMPDFDKYMEGNVTDWTAYLALEKVLEGWYKKTGVEYVEWLYTSLQSDPGLALKAVIKERGKNNTKPIP